MQNSTIKNIKVLKPSETLMAPKKAIQRMENIIQRDGADRALKSVSFQQVRECWVAGVFLLGMSQVTKKFYWIQSNPKPHEDPDVLAYSYREPELPGEIGVVKELQPIEVCEYTKHSNESLSDFIKTKLKNQQYISETILICYIQRPREAFRLVDVINGLKDLQTPIREIWLLYTLDELPASNFMAARVYFRGYKYGDPEMFLGFKGDYLKLCRIDQPEFMEDSRGMGKKVEWKKSEYSVVVPLPKDHLVSKI